MEWVELVRKCNKFPYPHTHIHKLPPALSLSPISQLTNSLSLSLSHILDIGATVGDHFIMVWFGRCLTKLLWRRTKIQNKIEDSGSLSHKATSDWELRYCIGTCTREKDKHEAGQVKWTVTHTIQILIFVSWLSHKKYEIVQVS